MRYENMSDTADTCCETSETFHLDMQASASELEDFVYLISHDVRNSVRALIELPQWIKEDLSQAGIKAEGSVAESIELMNSHTGRLDRMLVDLLTFSRVGRIKDEEQIGVDTALGDVLEQLPVPVGFKIGIRLSCNTLPMGARDILTLLTQLLSNAIKHHDKSSGEILVTLRDQGNQVTLRIQDDGPGIPSCYREQVFAAMTTLKPRDEVEGSGMGLAIVRKIVQFYNGQIVVRSGLNGRGTTIEVSLPAGQMSSAFNS